MLFKNNRIPKLLKSPIIGLKSKIIKIDLPLPPSSTNCQIPVHLQDCLSAHPRNLLLLPFHACFTPSEMVSKIPGHYTAQTVLLFTALLPPIHLDPKTIPLAL